MDKKKCKFKKPFDKDFSFYMSEAMRDTAKEIDGCLFTITHSDEASFVLRNDQSLETTPWFGNRIQKLLSVTASIFTAQFNNILAGEYLTAYFDARTFVVPNITEVCNYLHWQQNDVVKNSISVSCYYEVSEKVGKKTARKLMHGLNQNKQQELLFQQTGINWNDYPVKFKRGIGVRRVVREYTDGDKTYTRSEWEIDLNIPIFTKDREYLMNILHIEGDGA